MQTKLLEIRDSMTMIPALAIEISGQDGPLARRAGFGDTMIILIKLEDAQCQWDVYGWDLQRGRTMHEAHKYIQAHWEMLMPGDVVDVQFILGETPAPKVAEAGRY